MGLHFGARVSWKAFPVAKSNPPQLAQQWKRFRNPKGPPYDQQSALRSHVLPALECIGTLIGHSSLAESRSQ